MKAAKFAFDQAHDLPQALRLLPGAKAMGGGQSLGPMLNLRLVRPERVVDVSSLPEMRQCERRRDGYWIGGAMTHAEIEDGALDAMLVDAPAVAAMLRYVASTIAYRAVRNRGTLAGSLAHADPAADWILAMLALDAQIETVRAGANGIAAKNVGRKIPIAQFMSGAFSTALHEDELITGLLLPLYSPDMRWGYHKFCRKTGEFAESSAAAVFDANHGWARVVIGALDGAPARLDQLAAEVAAQGASAVTQDACMAAVSAAGTGRDEAGNWQIAVVVKRCLQQVVGEN